MNKFLKNGLFASNSILFTITLAAATKLLQLCLTLCDPMDGSLPGSPVPGILQARTLEWVAICFSNAWKWKVKMKSLSHVRPSAIFQARVLEWGGTVLLPVSHFWYEEGKSQGGDAVFLESHLIRPGAGVWTQVFFLFLEPKQITLGWSSLP